MSCFYSYDYAAEPSRLGDLWPLFALVATALVWRRVRPPPLRFVRLCAAAGCAITVFCMLARFGGGATIFMFLTVPVVWSHAPKEYRFAVRVLHGVLFAFVYALSASASFCEGLPPVPGAQAHALAGAWLATTALATELLQALLHRPRLARAIRIRSRRAAPRAG